MYMYTVWTQHVGISMSYYLSSFWFFIEHSITSTLQLVWSINLKVDVLYCEHKLRLSLQKRKMSKELHIQKVEPLGMHYYCLPFITV